jgi:hypothetical protein
MIIYHLCKDEDMENINNQKLKNIWSPEEDEKEVHRVKYNQELW